MPLHIKGMKQKLVSEELVPTIEFRVFLGLPHCEGDEGCKPQRLQNNLQMGCACVSTLPFTTLQQLDADVACKWLKSTFSESVISLRSACVRSSPGAFRAAILSCSSCWSNDNEDPCQSVLETFERHKVEQYKRHNKGLCSHELVRASYHYFLQDLGIFTQKLQ